MRIATRSMRKAPSLRPSGLATFAAAFSLVLLAPATQAAVQCETMMVDANGEDRDWFGNALAASGDVLVVGADGDDVGGVSQGSATVYRQSGAGWTQEAFLSLGATEGHKRFGASVAVDGDVIVVGAYLDDIGDNEDQGSATVYRWNGTTWAHEALLTRSGGSSSELFGYAVAVSGDVIAVTDAPFYGLSADLNGTATVFRWNGASWIEEATLSYSGLEEGDNFGESVATNGDFVVVGAWRHGLIDGLAAVFRWNGANWVEDAALTPGPENDGWFGYSLSMDGNVLAVGSNFGGGDQDGSVTIFREREGVWAEEAILVPGTTSDTEEFGHSVAVSGDVVVGGSIKDTVTETWQGSATVFRRFGTSWGEEQELTASDALAGERYGNAVAATGGTVFVGSSQHDVGPNDQQGTVYAYTPSVPSAEVVRVGVPANPAAFLPGLTSGPVLGATWDPVVDHTEFVADSISDFALVTAGPANLPLGPEGTLLCDLTSPLLAFVVSPAPGAPFAIPVPDKCPLAGLTICVQGGSIDGGLAAHLANALDTTIGTF